MRVRTPGVPRVVRISSAAVTTETEYVAALRQLARSREDDFTIDVGGVTLRVQYFSGSGSHVVVETPYAGVRGEPGAGDGYRQATSALSAPRPMRIELRSETSADMDAKRDGVAVEAQTGDEVFDDLVYIDTPTAPEVCRAVLAAPELRRAVEALLAMGAGPIMIDGLTGTITVRVHGFGGLSGDPKPMLEAFATIARSVPEVRSSGRPASDAHLGTTILLGAATVLGLAPMMAAMFLALPERCYSSDDEGISLSCVDPACCTPITWGGAVGALVGLVVGLVVRARIRGTSSAHRVRTPAAVFSVLLSVELGITLAHVVGAFALR